MKEETIIIVLCILLAITLGIILYQHFVFKRRVQREIREMNQSMERIIEGSSDEKIMVFTQHKGLITLVTQINQVLEERQKMKADFKHYEISSKKMLSNISHDIKTPLTVILGYIEIMRLNNQEDEMLSSVERKGKQVMELINQFFTLAKIEAGDMELDIKKINISEICRESILDFYHILSKQEIEVVLEIPEESLFVRGEEQAIRRILFNLISNALRYGAEGKFLGLSLYQKGFDVFIEVVDKGKGIEKGSIPYVFDRLYTQEDSRNNKIQGNGLGLSIVKSLVDALGGSISLESQPFVKTVFTVTLKNFSF